MAFEGHQSTFANSLFPTYQRQASVHVAGGNSGSMALPFVSIPSASLQEQDTTSYMPWSHNAHDDPFGLISCAQSNAKSRKSTDNADCDGETDLQGLVSNILDEADSRDSFFSDGSLPTCNPVWSPKTLRNELLQYFQSEAKSQQSPTFPQNFVSREASNKGQGQSVDNNFEEFSQQSNGLANPQQWLFNGPNGDRDNYTTHPQKLPPGLPMPNSGNSYLTQKQHSKYDNTSADRDRGNSQPTNNFRDFSDVFTPQSEMSSSCFHPYYEEQYTQNSSKPVSNDQYASQDINQLVSSFQSFMAGDHDNSCHADFPNMYRQTVGMPQEDTMVERWKSNSQAMPTQSAPAMPTQKNLAGELGRVQMEKNGGVRRQTFRRNSFQDLPVLCSQNTEYFQQQTKPFSTSLNPVSQYQNKMSMHRENTLLPLNLSMNQYSKHHIQQGQIKPQMQKEKKRMHMSGFLGEGFTTRPLTSTNTRDKKQALSHNPYFDHIGSTQFHRFDGGNGMVGAGNAQQFVPFMYPVNDPRRLSNMPINSSNFSSRSTLSYGSVDVANMMSTNESVACNSYVGDMMTRRGESTYHGMGSAMTTAMVMNQGGTMSQLYFYLDDCYEQWRCLEKERKRTEISLTKTFLGKRTMLVTNTNLPKTPPNPTRIDYLIINQMREQARVTSLFDRIECLQNITLHMNIHAALNRHQMAICITQARHKEEIANMSNHQQLRAHFTEDRDALLLVIALKDLAATTRKLRTALWCALQMTLPKPVKRLSNTVEKEATNTEKSASPFEGYSFRI